MSDSCAIVAGRVLTSDGFVETDLWVAGGLISDGAPDGDVVIDARDLLVAPGFVDLQINGGFGRDFTAGPTSIWEVGGRLPSTGVTSFLPTIITSSEEQRRRALEVIDQGPPPDYRGAQARTNLRSSGCPNWTSFAIGEERRGFDW